MRPRTWTLIKWCSLGTSVGSLLVAGVLMWTAEPETPPSDAADAETGHQTEVDRPVIVERRQGRTVWELRAGEAAQQANGSMKLSTPRLTLYTEAGVPVTITGENAIFNPVSRRLRFTSRVQVRYQDWLLQSERLVYESQRDEIVVPGRFRVSSPDLRAAGARLRINRSTEQARVDGGIRIDDSNPRWTGSAGR